MSIVRYVNYISGDDTWTGEHETNDPVGTGPKKHLQATINALTVPITEECIIKLAGTPENPQEYGDDDDEEIDLSRLMVGGDGEVIIQPGSWDNDAYENGEYPFSSLTGDFNPKDEKFCSLPSVSVSGAGRITLRGLKIDAAVSGSDGVGLSVESGQIHLHYCTVTGFSLGAGARMDGRIFITNSHIKATLMGIGVTDLSGLGLFGDNYIENCAKYGIFASNNSTVAIRSWDAKPFTRFTTRIYTLDSRRDYTAVKLMVNSTLYVGDPSGEIFGYNKPVLLEIINEKEFEAAGYRGIVLESRSLLVGSKYVAFAGKDSAENALNDGKDTVLKEQQYSGDDDSTIAD